ncbi:MAG: pyruvate kinase [Fimbriimonas ginsengisoli]|uniref:Pyruvate kinase n=1 Tax=Fimbriimonas ginsengisoli TaxID=1005039 RepID=A0A931PWP6_FIMGI|nr:pyruvate kinase [Fimbriimonas ginsengisoli]
MKRRTKIVCTLGPAVATKDRLRALIDAGMSVARINCSHGDWPLRRQWVEWLRELSPRMGPVAVMVDLQGPKFRLGDLPGKGRVHVRPGMHVTIGPDEGAALPLGQPEILAAIKPGDRLLLADGAVELRIVGSDGGNFEAKALSGGDVCSHHGVTLVGKSFDVPCLTHQDAADLQEAAAIGADFVALSYVRRASDIRELRRALDRLGGHAALCAKIETRDALQNIDDIVAIADIVMVARGDMGLQMEIEEVPLAQKRIVERCSRAGKPSIIATQMLESMLHSARPTRAEATDVANAILDGADAVMLSGETAVGDYPIQCVRVMARIAEKAEAMFDRERIERRYLEHGLRQPDHTEAVTFAVAELARALRPRAIVTTTTSGQTARFVSKFRPKAPILCASWKPETCRQMAIVWGVDALLVEQPRSTDDIVANALNGFLGMGRLKVGDSVIVTAGVPPGVPGNTNLILTQVVK